MSTRKEASLHQKVFTKIPKVFTQKLIDVKHTLCPISMRHPKYSLPLPHSSLSNRIIQISKGPYVPPQTMKTLPTYSIKCSVFNMKIRHALSSLHLFKLVCRSSILQCSDSTTVQTTSARFSLCLSRPPLDAIMPAINVPDLEP